MFVLSKKGGKKSNIVADAGHFLRTEKDWTHFKNENLTSKITTNKAEKPHFVQKKYSRRP